MSRLTGRSQRSRGASKAAWSPPSVPSSRIPAARTERCTGNDPSPRRLGLPMVITSASARCSSPSTCEGPGSNRHRATGAVEPSPHYERPCPFRGLLQAVGGAPIRRLVHHCFVAGLQSESCRISVSPSLRSALVASSLFSLLYGGAPPRHEGPVMSVPLASLPGRLCVSMHNAAGQAHRKASRSGMFADFSAVRSLELKTALTCRPQRSIQPVPRRTLEAVRIFLRRASLARRAPSFFGDGDKARSCLSEGLHHGSPVGPFASSAACSRGLTESMCPNHGRGWQLPPSVSTCPCG